MGFSKEISAFSSAAIALKQFEDKCLYCNHPLQIINSEENEDSTIGFTQSWIQKICPACGWWILEYFASDNDPGQMPIFNRGYAFGILERFNISNVKAPLNELRKYLIANYENRFDIHPRKLEEIVAGVFHDHGFKIELTSYSKDGGIDLYLLSSDCYDPVAVQIKRYKASRKIGIKEIDTFLGTLFRNKIHKGIYVTTSSYTLGALKVASAQSLKEQSFFIELWDAKRLLDALKDAKQASSADVAWKLKNVMPIEHEKSGDYFSPEAWPIEERSINHIEWWVSSVSSFSKQGAIFSNLSEILPKPANRKQILGWLGDYCDGPPCEVWYLTGGNFISGELLYCEYGKIRCTKKGTHVIVIGEGASTEEVQMNDGWGIEGDNGIITYLNLDSIIKITPKTISVKEYVHRKWPVMGDQE